MAGLILSKKRISMTDIVGRLWGFCHTFRHDGINLLNAIWPNSKREGWIWFDTQGRITYSLASKKRFLYHLTHRSVDPAIGAQWNVFSVLLHRGINSIENKFLKMRQGFLFKQTH